MAGQNPDLDEIETIDPDDESGETPEQKPSQSFDSWITGQSDEVRNLISQHTNKLKSALEKERSERKAFQRELKTLSEKLKAGENVQAQMEKLNGQIEESNTRADFYETASEQGCTNLRLAWLAAKEDGLTEKEMDWKRFRKSYPQLFGVSAESTGASAGAGTNRPGKSELSMNDWIRGKVGR